jgi:hypothetical protein
MQQSLTNIHSHRHVSNPQAHYRAKYPVGAPTRQNTELHAIGLMRPYSQYPPMAL